MTSGIERTLVMIKPCALPGADVWHHIVHPLLRARTGILSPRFDGSYPVDMQAPLDLETSWHVLLIRGRQLTGADVDVLYPHVRDRPFYPTMQRFLMHAVSTCVILEGRPGLAKVIRGELGSLSEPNSLRGLLRGLRPTEVQGTNAPAFDNVIHTSDSAESAEREIAYLFAPADLTFRGKWAEKDMSRYLDPEFRGFPNP